MPADETSSVVKDETARQVVVLLFGVASVLLYVWAQRWAADPDVVKTSRMQAMKKTERAYARAAAWCWRRAEQSRLAYERDRA